jgi:hypothetical protein
MLSSLSLPLLKKRERKMGGILLLLVLMLLIHNLSSIGCSLFVCCMFKVEATVCILNKFFLKSMPWHSKENKKTKKR